MEQSMLSKYNEILIKFYQLVPLKVRMRVFKGVLGVSNPLKSLGF